jgi:hypothetical protein
MQRSGLEVGRKNRRTRMAAAKGVFVVWYPKREQREVTSDAARIHSIWETQKEAVETVAELGDGFHYTMHWIREKK